jgi:hypothetical protein
MNEVNNRNLLWALKSLIQIFDMQTVAKKKIWSGNSMLFFSLPTWADFFLKRSLTPPRSTPVGRTHDSLVSSPAFFHETSGT